MQIFIYLLKFDAEHTGHDKVAYLLIIKSALVAHVQTHKKLYSYVESRCMLAAGRRECLIG